MRQSGITNIQYIQRTMAMTVIEILTALYENIIEGLASYGYGVTGLHRPENDPTLGPCVATEKASGQLD